MNSIENIYKILLKAKDALEEDLIKAKKEKDYAKSVPNIEDDRASYDLLKHLSKHWLDYHNAQRKVTANPTSNPELFEQGHAIAAAAAHGRDFNEAYAEHKKKHSDLPASKRAILDVAFRKKWHEDNPDGLERIIHAVNESHQHGEKAKDAFKRKKQAIVNHMITGGGAVSTNDHEDDEDNTDIQNAMDSEVNKRVATPAAAKEKAMQDVGGAKIDADQGTQASMSEDPAIGFANRNAEYLKGLALIPTTEVPEHELPKGSSNISAIQPHSDLKDPVSIKHINKLTSAYYPLINGASYSVAKKMLPSNAPKQDLEAKAADLSYSGLIGLMKALNEHDINSGKTLLSVATNKIYGEMKNAAKEGDPVPSHVRKRVNALKAGRLGSHVLEAKEMPITTIPKASEAPQPTSEAVSAPAEAAPPVPTPQPMSVPAQQRAAERQKAEETAKAQSVLADSKHSQVGAHRRRIAQVMAAKGGTTQPAAIPTQPTEPKKE